MCIFQPVATEKDVNAYW